MRFLQNHPLLLEKVYRFTYALLRPFRRWLFPGGVVERLFIGAERVSKGVLFDCRMCGQCILHSTGMTCPMTCPKQMRNGPCGGVRPDGRCEVVPDMMCVWLQAWERSKAMPGYGQEILILQPPTNHRLKGTSAWINDLNPIVPVLPKGW
jgi:hypothetical protein